MAEANPPRANKDSPSTESGLVEETSQSRVNRISLPTSSDAMDATQSRVNRISLPTSSDAMDATQSRVNRISLSTSSDAMDAAQSRVNRISLSTGSDAMDAAQSRVNRISLSTSSDAMDATHSRVNRISLSTSSDAMDATQSRVNRISLSTSSDAMDATQSRVNRMSLSTGSDAMDATLSRVNRKSLSTGSDAIPDVKRHTLSSGSDVIFELICIPCDNSGDLNEAVGYCTKCDEHMCQTCLQSHKQTHSIKHHTLLDKAAMPRVQSTTSDKYTDTERCKVHTDKMVKYYCPSHKALACGVCLISTHHNKCQGTIYIPDEAKQLNSKEFGEFQALINDLTKKSNNLSKSLDAYNDIPALYLSNALRDIETFQQDVNDELEKFKATIVEQMEEISAQDMAAMSSAADKNNQVQTELQTMLVDIKALLGKHQHCQAFIEMKNAESKRADFQQQLDDIGNISPTIYTFQPRDDLQKLIREKDVLLGELTFRNMEEIRAKHIGDLKVKTKDNKRPCSIFGCTVLSPTRLAVVDINNKTVKLIDTERQRVISEYKPGSFPYDVTTVNGGIAVTLPDAGKIIFMKADDKLRLDKEIHVDHKCLYISYTDDQLVVGCWSDPAAVRVLSMTGQLLQSFSTSSPGEPLFSCIAPRVTVSPVTGNIYACDQAAHRVLQLHHDRSVVAAYRDKDMRKPSYAAIDELGVIYVTGLSSNNVHVLTPGCSKVKVILTERDGIESPESISYCRNTRRLYIGLRGSDNLKVYQLS